LTSLSDLKYTDRMGETMRLRAKLSAVIVAIGAVAAIAACGAGSESGTTVDAAVTSGGSGATISKAMFIKRGDVICTRTESEISEALGSAATKLTAGGKSLTRSEEKMLLRTITAPNIQQMAEDLAKLPPPHGAKDASSRLIHEIEAAAAMIEKTPSAPRANDLIAEAASKAAAFGFHACSLI
jgi:hypothetical protein